MFDISKKMEDKLVLGDKEYQLFLSFDRVLRVFDMWQNEDVPDGIKPQLALSMLTKAEDFQYLDVETAFEIYQEVFKRHIKVVKPIDEVDRYDIEGNLLPKKSQTADSDEKPLMVIKYDGEYIFASFLQAYQMDLIEMQGKLHWKKFNALLFGLPEGTKMVEVMKIRAWKPSSNDSQKERQTMRELQEQYALPKE
ncbi:Gp15 family bacteriophage protein [Streptococcus dysgalactiae]|uniref:Bacteriophage Gp15 family protein n=1 Tax=Streptococcus dysgalactiae TaxID=1334 RepID=A0AAE9UMK0_STRDY|nr:Gp15 family bacteriophage protein [Streptococcus dysgalactiae]HES3276607.1 bacteriophage Gp15 family protein [Streptococcus pyogenes]MEC4578073.1 Gp15 family bacteriophage protein [Streptococcus dysgalactiae]QGH05076.1 hypothetical protein EA458_11875 [Streptococcus dysgalactiae subsp. dysgalactiae]WAI93235.1 bacteriophage Gp15 family protein [Streptococcus dysgalactiae]WCE86332.1 Gp15 family bacteriophage protein [Streptococcus dysgalactiae]